MVNWSSSKGPLHCDLVMVCVSAMQVQEFSVAILIVPLIIVWVCHNCTKVCFKLFSILQCRVNSVSGPVVIYRIPYFRVVSQSAIEYSCGFGVFVSGTDYDKTVSSIWSGWFYELVQNLIPMPCDEDVHHCSAARVASACMPCSLF